MTRRTTSIRASAEQFAWSRPGISKIEPTAALLHTILSRNGIRTESGDTVKQLLDRARDFTFR